MKANQEQAPKIRVIAYDFDHTLNNPDDSSFYHGQQLEVHVKGLERQGVLNIIVSLGQAAKISSRLDASFPKRDFLKAERIWGVERIVAADPNSKRFARPTKATSIELFLEDYNKDHPDQEPLTMANVLFIDDSPQMCKHVREAGAHVYEFNPDSPGDIPPPPANLLKHIATAAQAPVLMQRLRTLFRQLDELGDDLVKSDKVKAAIANSKSTVDVLQRLEATTKPLQGFFFYKAEGSVADRLTKIQKAIDVGQFKKAGEELTGLERKFALRSQQQATDEQRPSSPGPGAQ